MEEAACIYLNCWTGLNSILEIRWFILNYITFLKKHHWKQVLSFHWLNHFHMQRCIKIPFSQCISFFLPRFFYWLLYDFSNYHYSYYGLLKHNSSYWVKSYKRSLSISFTEMWQLVINRNENHCQALRYLIGIFALTVFQLWIFAVSVSSNEIT